MATAGDVRKPEEYTTAWRHANGEYPVREISMAKLHASRIAVEVADECIQIQGGAGYMKQYVIERVWRDLATEPDRHRHRHRRDHARRDRRSYGPLSLPARAAPSASGFGVSAPPISTRRVGAGRKIRATAPSQYARGT